jgi:hypothetical protein
MSKKIYPADFAAMLVKCAGEKYRPSNGTEGDLFFASWCAECERDKVLCNQIDFDDAPDGDLCPIIGLSFLHNVEDAEYPQEWQYGKDGQPCCTAFVAKGQPIPPERCKHTVDMFEAVKP